MDEQRLKGILASWLSVPQAAEHLGLCTTTVYALIRRGEIPASRLGRHLRVDPKKLDAWIEAGGVKGAGREGGRQ